MSDSWLKTSLDKIDSKVDQIDQRLNNVDITLAKQSLILEEHQKRSFSNEENLKLLRADFKPVERHVIIANGIFKAIGVVGTMVSLLAGIIKIIYSLH